MSPEDWQEELENILDNCPEEVDILTHEVFFRIKTPDGYRVIKVSFDES